MKTITFGPIAPARSAVAAVAVFGAVAVLGLLASLPALAQSACNAVTTDLQFPLGIVQSNKGHMITAEAGTPTPNTGRLSIVDANGDRRTLVSGLPSGIADVGDVNGPAGLFIRGRTLYVAIGVGDVGILGRNSAGVPVPGSNWPNPNGPSSPLFSSVLAMHFSANVEDTAGDFALTRADQDALAAAAKVTLRSGSDRLEIERVADFPNYVPFPHPAVADNVRLSNPYGIVAVEDQLYVTDGGRNHVWQVDIPTGSYSVLAAFPNIPNPLFGIVGGPTMQAVPTGIAWTGEELLVTLFRGAPFAAGTSTVETIDVLTGEHGPLISGLKTAIGVRPVTSHGDTDYLVLQFSSGAGPFFPGPGLLLHYAAPDAAPATVADCLSAPTAMVLDKKGGTLYVTEFESGHLVAITLPR